MSVTAILLAAGRGRRFDPRGVENKLLQPLADGTPVVVASARQLLAVTPRVIAVVAAHDGGVAARLHALGCEVTVCPDADLGMAASLVHALKVSLPASTGWLVALGDMPYVQVSTLRALLQAQAAGADIAVPVHAGRRGNPVAFSARHVPDLLALQGDQGARGLLSTASVTAVAVDDPGILRDIDVPADIRTDL